MYICKDCGEVFEKAVVVREDPSPQGVSLTAGEYEYETCPYCDSDNIDGAEECVCCGEYHDADEGIICEECKDGIKEELEEIRIRNGFTKDDFEQVVAEIFGW